MAILILKVENGNNNNKRRALYGQWPCFNHDTFNRHTNSDIYEKDYFFFDHWNLFGGILLAQGNVIQGILAAAEHIIKAAADEQSIYIIFFLFLFGAFAEIMKV